MGYLYTVCIPYSVLSEYLDMGCLYTVCIPYSVLSI